MTHQEPAVVAHHDEWTAIPGTPFEVHQASGTNVAVYVVDGAVALDVDATVKLRLNQSGISIRQYGVRMHPNPEYHEPPPGPSVREVVSVVQAREEIRDMNRLAASAASKDYWVLLAELVTRQRIVLPDTGEIYTPWTVVDCPGGQWCQCQQPTPCPAAERTDA